MGLVTTEHAGVSLAIWDAQAHGIQNSDITKHLSLSSSLRSISFQAGKSVLSTGSI